MKKHIIQIIVALTLILFIFFLVAPLKQWSEARTAAFRDRILTDLQNRLNIDVAFQSLSPAIFRSLTLKNLSVADKLGAFSMDTEKVRIGFQLKKKEGIPLEINRVILTHGRISISSSNTGNSTDPEELLMLLKNVFADSRLEIRDFYLEYQQEDIEALVYIDRLILDPRSDEYSLRLRGSVDGLLLQEDKKYVNAQFRSRGVIDRDFKNLTMDSNVENIRTSWLDMEDQRFYLALNQDNITLRKIKDNQPLDLELQYKIAEKDINMYWVSEQFVPANQVELKQELALFNPWLSTGISGTAEVKYNIEDKSLYYDFDTQIVIDNKIMNEYVPEQTVVTAVFRGDQKGITVDQLLAETSLADVSYQGTMTFADRIPKGILVLEDYYLPNGYPLSMVIELDYFENILNLRTASIEIGGFDPGVWELLVQLDREQQELYFSSQLTKNSQSVFLDGKLVYGAEKSIEAWYDIGQFQIGQYYPYLLDLNNENLHTYLDRSQLDSSGEFFWSENKQWLTTDSFQVEQKGETSYLIQSTFSWDGEFYSINDLLMEYSGIRIEGLVQGAFEDRILTTELFLNQGDYSYDLDLKWKMGQSIEINGNYGLSASLQFLNSGNLLFNGQCLSLPLDLGTDDFYISLDAKGRIYQGKPELHITDSSVLWQKNDEEVGLLQFSCLADSSMVEIYQLSWQDKTSSLQGQSNLMFSPITPVYASGWLDLGNGREKVQINFSWNEGGRIAGILKTGNLSLSHFITQNQNVEGNLNSSLKVQGTLKEPVLDGLISGQLAFQESPVNISTSLHYENRQFELEQLGIQTENIDIQEGMVYSDLKNNNLFVSFPIQGLLNNKPWNTTISANIKTNPIDSMQWDEMDIFGEVLIEPLIWNNETLSPSMILQARSEDQRISIFHEDRDVFRLFYDNISKKISLSSRRLLPVSLDLNGQLSDQWRLNISNIESDLHWVNRFMPEDPLGRKIISLDQGVVKGKLVINGDQDNLSMEGALSINNIKLDSLYTYKEIDPFNIDVNFSDNQIQINDFSTMVGEKGRLYSSAIITLEGRTINDVQLRGRLESVAENGGVKIIYPVAGLNLDGEAAGDFQFLYNPLESRFDGNFELNHLTISLGARQETRDKSEKKSRNDAVPFILSLNFVTGEDVRFVLPNEELTFMEAEAAKDQTLSLFLDTSNERLTFQGDLIIDQGEILYVNRSFYLSQGILNFDETGDNFNPSMSIEAEYYTEDDQENPVTIILAYSGSLFDDYEPTLSSDSALSQSQILALLGQPVGDIIAGNEEVISSLVSATSSVIGQYSLVLPFESALQEALNLDKVTVDTSLIENILLGQIQPEGVFTDENNQYNLWEYLDGTRLDLGKYLAEKLYLNGSVVINSGNNRIDRQSDLKLDFGFSFEMATPFFDIGWSYLPDQYDTMNSEDAFISDTAVTLEFHL